MTIDADTTLINFLVLCLDVSVFALTLFLAGEKFRSGESWVCRFSFIYYSTFNRYIFLR